MPARNFAIDRIKDLTGTADPWTSTTVLAHALFCVVQEKYGVRYGEEDELVNQLVESHVDFYLRNAAIATFPGQKIGK